MGEVAKAPAKAAAPARAEWDNHTQFLLACLAFGVGLGNVWRFPYLIQKYGGGSFVFVFLIMMVFEGVPLLLIEFMLGQRWKRGSVGMWNKLHPLLGGIGIAAAMEAFIICVYYTAIVCWCFFYLFNSFQAPLPWSECEITLINGTAAPVAECVKSSPTEYFWYRKAMDITDTIDDSGGFNAWILIVFVMTWCFVYLCVSKGVESSGKAMYITSSFPYLVLLIFLIRGLTLEGSVQGIQYLFRVDWENLADPNLWLDAATQVFFSLSVAAGGIIAFASYCPLHQNCMMDSLVIGGMNAFTALYVAVVIFSILGFKATLQFHECLDGNIDIFSDKFNIPYGEMNYDTYNQTLVDYGYEGSAGEQELEKLGFEYCDFEYFISHGVEGTGLAFIVFTEAINNMPGSPIWSVLFFVMLLLLGLGTVFGYVEGIITPIFDLGVKMDKRLLSALCCTACAALGLVFTLRSGEYWVNVFNDFGANLPLLIIGFAEILACIWFFGIDKWFTELRFMIGESTSTFDRICRWYFYLCWNFISPALLLIVLCGYIYTTVSTTFMYDAWSSSEGKGVKLDYGGSSMVAIILLQAIPISMIPIWAIYKKIRPSTFEEGDENAPLIDWSDAWLNVKGLFKHDIGKTISK
jgi:SNF family Na+-dependent transporter